MLLTFSPPRILYFLRSYFFLYLLLFILSTLCNWTPSCCASTQIDKFTWDAGQVKRYVSGRLSMLQNGCGKCLIQREAESN